MFFGMRAPIWISAVAASFSLFIPLNALAQQKLAVVNAGVQAEEDVPFVSLDYQFLPGDHLYFTFEITGFTIAQKEDSYAEITRRISLSYDVTPEDAAGRPLAPAASGKIAEMLHPQDKHWVPKRRESFLLPSFVAAGKYRIHVMVKDALGKTETTRDVPFMVGGTQIKPSPAVNVQNFQFLRTASSTKALQVAAYSPGDHIFARFDVSGYKLGPKNSYDVAYGITVLGPDGKPFIKQPNAAELKSSSFYPAQFVPASLNLTTNPKSALGAYVIVLSVRDLIGGRSSEQKEAFTLE